MKRFAIALVLVALAQPARAQVHVIDDASLTQEIKSYLQILRSYATQLQQYQQELQTAISTGRMVAGMIQNPSLGAAMTLMNMAGLDSAIPVNPYAVQGIIAGRANIAGLPGQLSNLINGSFASNTVYTCTDNSWACQQTQANSRGLNGTQGLAMSALQAVANHVPIMQALRDQLAAADDPAKRENAMAALQTEQAWTQQQQLQLTSITMLMASEQNLRDQRATEKLQQDLTNTINRIPGG